MILGVEIENFDVFDKDLAGILIDESISIAKDREAAVHNSLPRRNALAARKDSKRCGASRCR